MTHKQKSLSKEELLLQDFSRNNVYPQNQMHCSTAMHLSFHCHIVLAIPIWLFWRNHFMDLLISSSSSPLFLITLLSTYLVSFAYKQKFVLKHKIAVKREDAINREISNRGQENEQERER